ncbi:MAG: NAD(P)/FAD-dependent oxidoreductase [Maricaulaceae bacterium]|jgi:phytoene dehydrogenase-like protein
MTTVAANDNLDALIIGGGHNGLVCAFYLARAGLRVRVLERAGVVGGAAVTEEFHPGFRNSVASYTVSLLSPKVIADMELAERGLKILPRPLANFFPFEDGRFLKIGGGLARTQAELAKFSQKDAAAYPAYAARLSAVADLLRRLAEQTPPSPRRGWSAAATAGRQLYPALKGGTGLQQDVLDLVSKSARSLLEGWFEAPQTQAAFGFDAIVGTFASPDTPGTAYVLLHHVFGEVNGERGAWGHAVGGMGAITRAMARACEAAGAELATDAEVAEVLVEKDKAVGVRLADGRVMGASIVASGVNPKLLYTRLTPADALPAEFLRRMRAWRNASGVLRMNVALSELPQFSCLPQTSADYGAGEHLGAGIVIAPSLDYMDRAYIDAKALGWSRKPMVEMLIPSTVDDSLAPPGAHVASLFAQQFAPELPPDCPAGRSWSDAREAAADAVIAAVDAHAPNFSKSVIARTILSPQDLEDRFGLLGGDIFHGAMTLDQLWASRPALGAGDYRGPLKGLYHCGSGAHPGGGVTGLPGRNAAREILRDRSLRGPR